METEENFIVLLLDPLIIWNGILDYTETSIAEDKYSRDPHASIDVQ